METYLRLRWARPRQAKVYHNINVASSGGWPRDYRIPDPVLVSPERFDIDRNEYFEGALDVVVEIRSPFHHGIPRVQTVTFHCSTPLARRNPIPEHSHSA
jgi:Uma2 family endonuclease